MAIVKEEFLWRPSTFVNNSSSNGGRMGTTTLADAIKNNVWPDVDGDELTAGSTTYRKLFLNVANDDDLTLSTAKFLLENYSPGDDIVTMFPGTFEDDEGDLTGSERLYGCGQLDVTVVAAVTSIDVLTEDAASDMFQNGDMIRISDKDGMNAAGNREYVTINAVPTYSGDVATIVSRRRLLTGIPHQQPGLLVLLRLPI